jgi:hypothetical protein
MGLNLHSPRHQIQQWKKVEKLPHGSRQLRERVDRQCKQPRRFGLCGVWAHSKSLELSSSRTDDHTLAPRARGPEAGNPSRTPYPDLCKAIIIEARLELMVFAR